MTALVRDFGATVRSLREALSWSQEQLAEFAGLNRSYVGEIERGSAIASIVTADKLARALNVPIATLLCASSTAEACAYEQGAASSRLPV